MTQLRHLVSPAQLLSRSQSNQPPKRPVLRPLNLQQPSPPTTAPQQPKQPTVKLTSISSLLRDRTQISTPSRPSQPAILPIFQPQPRQLQAPQRQAPVQQISVSSTGRQRQQVIVNSAMSEWQNGVRESGGRNRGPRIDQYAKNSGFSPGKEWCGFFTSFNYSKAGFKSPSSFASYQKARDFFLYRSYTSRSSKLHTQLDQQRQKDQASGSSRQYFAMSESNVFKYVGDRKQYYPHIDPNQLKHTWQNIPIQPGDVALFNHGHVGMVVSYDARSGNLVTLEGNTSGEGPDGKRRHQAVVRKTYNLSTPADRQKFDGFGRAADNDFK